MTLGQKLVTTSDSTTLTHDKMKARSVRLRGSG